MSIAAIGLLAVSCGKPPPPSSVVSVEYEGEHVHEYLVNGHIEKMTVPAVWWLHLANGKMVAADHEYKPNDTYP